LSNYFDELSEKYNNLTDEEVYQLLVESGLEECPYEEKNKEEKT